MKTKRLDLKEYKSRLENIHSELGHLSHYIGNVGLDLWALVEGEEEHDLNELVSRLDELRKKLGYETSKLKHLAKGIEKTKKTKP